MARRQSLFRDGAFLAALFLLLALIAAKLDEGADNVVRGPFHAIDGDTIGAGSERLRLTGLDAPEIDQTCEDGQGRQWACGSDAKRLLGRLIGQGEVECLGRERDRYGRLLMRCHAGGEDINAVLVRQGLAVASGSYDGEQTAARRERLGVWAGRFENPRDWRVSRGMMEDAGFKAVIWGWFERQVNRQ